MPVAATGAAFDRVPILPAASAASLAKQGLQDGGQRVPFERQIQASFGHYDVSKISAHLGKSAARSSRALGAEAYATGGHIVFGSAPSMRTAAHEAAHAIQQQQGVKLPEGVSAPDDHYEKQADAIAERVVRGESSQSLLDQNRGAHSPSPAAASPVSQSPSASASAPIQRLILRFGDIEKNGYLDDETDALKDRYDKEQTVTVKDKWGDERPRNWLGIPQGPQKFGKRKSIKQMPWNKSLRALPENQDLRLVAHGNSSAKIAGYTGVKMARQLIGMGLERRHRGRIFIHGCLAAYRPGPNTPSFIEGMYGALQAQRYTNDVYGLAGIAKSGGSPDLNAKYEQHIAEYTAKHQWEEAAAAYDDYRSKPNANPTILSQRRTAMNNANANYQAAHQTYGGFFLRQWIVARTMTVVPNATQSPDA